jgi:hypothetical protein
MSKHMTSNRKSLVTNILEVKRDQFKIPLIFKRFLVTKLLIKKKYEMSLLHLQTDINMLIKIDFLVPAIYAKIGLMNDIVVTYRIYRFPI